MPHNMVKYNDFPKFSSTFEVLYDFFMLKEVFGYS